MAQMLPIRFQEHLQVNVFGFPVKSRSGFEVSLTSFVTVHDLNVNLPVAVTLSSCVFIFCIMVTIGRFSLCSVFFFGNQSSEFCDKLGIVDMTFKLGDFFGFTLVNSCSSGCALVLSFFPFR